MTKFGELLFREFLAKQKYIWVTVQMVASVFSNSPKTELHCQRKSNDVNKHSINLSLILLYPRLLNYFWLFFSFWPVTS